MNRKKLSSILKQQGPTLPVRGMDGYGGEQDGSYVLFSDIIRFTSKQEADTQFPSGVPEYVKLHWAKYNPGRGWEAVFGWWSDQITTEDHNPLISSWR